MFNGLKYFSIWSFSDAKVTESFRRSKNKLLLLKAECSNSGMEETLW